MGSIIEGGIRYYKGVAKELVNACEYAVERRKAAMATIREAEVFNDAEYGALEREIAELLAVSAAASTLGKTLDAATVSEKRMPGIPA